MGGFLFIITFLLASNFFNACAFDGADEKTRMILSDSLAMEQSLLLAIERNPALSAIKNDVRMAEARINQAKLLPNPVISFETENGALRSFGIDKSTGYLSGVTQTILLGGKIDSRVRVAEYERDITIKNYEQKEKEIIAETRKAFIDVLTFTKLLQISSNTVQIANELFDAIKIKVEARATPVTDLIRAELELSQSTNDLTHLRASLLNATNHLNTLLGQPEPSIVAIHGTLEQDFQFQEENDLQNQVITLNPEISKADISRKLASSILKLAYAERFPELEVGVAINHQKELENYSRILQWTLTLPIPIFNRNQAQIKESLALIEKSEKEYEETFKRLRSEINENAALFKSYLNQYKMFEEKIIQLSEESLSLIREGYSEGKFTYIELLEAQRTLNTTYKDYVTLLQNLNYIAIEIDRLTNKSIEEITRKDNSK